MNPLFVINLCAFAFAIFLIRPVRGLAAQNSTLIKDDALRARKWVGNDGTSMNYLSFTPRTHCKTVPLIVYFGGSGEMGDDIRAVMHQKTIFSVVTSKDFQKKHPSCLIAPQLPNGVTIHSGLPNCPNALARSLHSLCIAESFSFFARTFCTVAVLLFASVVFSCVYVFFPASDMGWMAETNAPRLLWTLGVMLMGYAFILDLTKRNSTNENTLGVRQEDT